MIHTRKTYRPGLEALEDRTVPATLRLLGGNLFLSNPFDAGGTTDLRLTAVANNKFDIFDNGTKLATVTVGGSIFYTGTNLADTLTVEMGANTFTGNLLAFLGNSGDTVDIFAGGGAILGNVNVQTGRGNDTTNLNNGEGAMTFGGTVAVFDFLGLDTVNLGNATSPTKFLGDMQLLGANTVNAGAGVADFVGGNLSVQSLTEGTAMALTFADNFAVNGRTSVRGTSAADTVDIGLSTFNGNAQFALGSGNDTFNINGVGATFNGNLDLDLGEGSNEVTLSNAFTVAGHMTLRNSGVALASTTLNPTIGGNFSVLLGNGDYSLDIADTALVAGHLSIRSGNGTSTFGIQNAVGGNLSVTVGNGVGNSTQIFGPAAIGGRVIYRGGNGGSTLLLGATGLYRLDVLFGNGDDCLTFAGAGVQITGRADGGGGSNDGLGDTTGVDLLPTLTLASFEVNC